MKKVIWVIEISYKAFDWKLNRECYTDWTPTSSPPIESRALARKSLTELRKAYSTNYYGWKYRISKYERVTGV
jgi:hypothetical protein